MKLFEPGGLLVMLVIVLVIFGPTQLPKVAKMLGQSSKALRDGIEGKLEDEPSPAAASAAKDPEE